MEPLRFDRSLPSRFLRDDAGNVTVEMLLWMPLYAALVFITVDMSRAHVRHAEMWHTAYDTARQVAMGNFKNKGQSVETLVGAYVAQSLGPDYSVTYSKEGGYHTVSLEVSAAKVAAYSILPKYFGKLGASVSISREDL